MTPDQHEAIMRELRAHTQLLTDLLKSSVAGEQATQKLNVTGHSLLKTYRTVSGTLEMVCQRCAYPRKIDIVDASTYERPYATVFGRTDPDPCPACGLSASPSPRRMQP